jgi:heat shock protein HtpX
MVWKSNKRLQIQIAFTLTLIFLFIGIFAGGITWFIILFSEEIAQYYQWSQILTSIILLSLVWFGIISLILSHNSSTEIIPFSGSHLIPKQATEQDHPLLCKMATQLSQQCDTPVPSIAIIETPYPLSVTTGFRRQDTTVVLSTGLIQSLTSEELEAVLAHEFAHIMNRDSMVITLASLPEVVAQRLISWLSQGYDENPRQQKNVLWGMISAIIIVFAGLVWVIGRVQIRCLSRYRELAADRGAVAIIGSSTGLASALKKLDESTVDPPTTDYRVETTIRAFSIIDLEPSGEPLVTLGAEGEKVPIMYRIKKKLLPVVDPLFRTHPSTEKRLSHLRSIERQ